jgi:UPF0271 protein
LIESFEAAIEQVLQMVNKKIVISQSGKEVPIKADTICIHGDNEHAAVFAKSIFETLKQNQVVIKAV